MLSRVGFAARKAPIANGARGMATAQQLKYRIRSVKNTKKITSAMKMVAVCKLRAAQEQLDAARDFSAGFGKITPEVDQSTLKYEKPLYIGVTADKGLCGAINSSIVRAIRDKVNDDDKGGKIFVIGEKGKQGLERAFGKMFEVSVAEPGGLTLPTFKQVGVLADYWSQHEHDVAIVYFQKFKSMIAYDTTQEVFVNDVSPEAFADFEMEGDPDILQNLNEFRNSVMLYYFLAEHETSMLSARMNAMDNSSKNAGEMIEKLELLMNRTRQAKITTELTEIISGAAAVE